MNDRVNISTLEEKVMTNEVPPAEDLKKVKEELEVKKEVKQEKASEKVEAVAEGKITTSQFVEISTPTSRTLLTIDDHFPMDLWPDKLIVDEIKVSAIYIRPLGIERVNSILIKDINDVSVTMNPLWAAISISGGDFKPDISGGKIEDVGKGPLKMKFLNKKEAARARRIILGLIVLNDRKVDTSKISISELLAQAEELGRARK